MLLDQRGCGRSPPHASEPDADLSANTTWHLVADLERLRDDRGIDRWLVFGGSWGSALALAYAERTRDRVTRAGPARHLHPAAQRAGLLLQRRRRAAVPGAVRDVPRPARRPGFRGDAIAAYHDLLFDPDPAVHGPAGVAWTSWEAATITLEPNAALIAAFSEPAYALAFARIENHYFVNGGWFARGPADRRRGPARATSPAVIVQGRYDVATPAVTAYDLHQAWPEAEFTVAPVAGHAYSEPGILRLWWPRDRFAVIGLGPGWGCCVV